MPVSQANANAVVNVTTVSVTVTDSQHDGSKRVKSA